jgi:N-acetylglucosaminyldiphosphoundecaprenol N-acetyl-beta-D-mannosaminyltransferase
MNKYKKTYTILGQDFAELTQSEVLQKVTAVWQSGGRLRITTVNPEFLVASSKNERFAESLAAADIRTVDGFGLWLALYTKGLRTQRITGADILAPLLALAESQEQQVCIVLLRGGLSTKEVVKNILQIRYPRLRVDVCYEDEDKQDSQKRGLTLFALGAPEQEYQAAQIEQGVAIGIGGAIDYLTGAQKRAPKCMRSVGLEWLWRLWQNPKRLGRIINATAVFMWCVFTTRSKDTKAA